MNCELAHEQIVAAAYGELPDDQVHQLNRHVIACSECQKEREQVLALKVLALGGVFLGWLWRKKLGPQGMLLAIAASQVFVVLDFHTQRFSFLGMLCLGLALILGLSIVPTLTVTADAPPIVGDWGGTLDPGAQPKKRILVHISAGQDGTLSGTIDYPD